MGSITKITICCALILVVLISGCKNPLVVSAYIYLVQQSNPDKAKEVLDKALEQNPNDPEAHYVMGMVHLAKFQYVDMVASFKRSLELSSKFKTSIDTILFNQWRGFYTNALVKFDSLDYDATLENLGTAVMIFPNRYETYYLIGMTYESIDSMEAAAENYQKAIEKNTDEKNLNLYYNLANTLFRLEKWDESLNYSQIVSDEATADIIAADLLIADLLPKDSLVADSLAAVTATLKELQMDAVKISAVSLSNLERPGDALAIYNEIIAASPDDPNPVFDRALLHIEMGDTTRAIQDFENVVSLDPNDIDALKQLGWFYLEGGTFIDYQLALDYYQKAYALYPDQYIINRGIGVVLVKLERVEEAHEYLERAKELRQ